MRALILLVLISISTLQADTTRKAGVFLGDSHLEFTRAHEWTGGPEVYQATLKKFKSGLDQAGYTAALIPESEIFKGALERYRTLLIADTLAVSGEAFRLIKSFVKRGGLLILAGDNFRNIDGSWIKDWPLAALTGLNSLEADKWGTSGSWNDGMYIKAFSRMPDHSLMKDLPAELDLGKGTEHCWVTEPDQAELLAIFPQYFDTFEGRSEAMNKEITALSLNHYGKGNVIFLSSLPGGRGGDLTSDMISLLGNSHKYTLKDLDLPEKPEPRFFLTASQTGYLPEEKKTLILRALNAGKIKALNFRILDASGNAVLEGKMKKTSCYEWEGLYFSADFSALTNPGTYSVRADLTAEGNDVHLETGAFVIQEKLFSKTLLSNGLHFLETYSAGKNYYQNDPVPGGFIDATGDYSVWMWSMPHAVFGLSEALEVSDNPENQKRIQDLLIHSADWCVQMQKPDGDIYTGISPGEGIFVLDKRPWEDTTERNLMDKPNFNYLVTYTAAMARAARLFENEDRGTAYKKSALKAYQALGSYTVESSYDIGNQIWASCEMYRLTGDQVYLDRAVRSALALCARQESSPVGQKIRGFFYSHEDRSGIDSFQQYKMFHHIGLYIGLISLSELLPEGENADKINSSLKLWLNGYLKQMSGLSPYGQMAHGLEPDKKGTLQPAYFPSSSSWIGLHALNCDHGAFALIALKGSHLFQDKTLYHTALDQLQWILGQNPLNYSMITGQGHVRPELIPDHLGTGYVNGGIPNGIGGGLTDEPTWGKTWDSREYWIPQVVYFHAAALLAENLAEKFNTGTK